MGINKFIQNWLAIANAFDTKKFVELWHQNAILDDPSVGQIFKGQQGIILNSNQVGVYLLNEERFRDHK